MKKRAGPLDRSAASLAAGYSPPAPPPTGFEVQKRARLDGPIGEEPRE